MFCTIFATVKVARAGCASAIETRFIALGLHRPCSI